MYVSDVVPCVICLIYAPPNVQAVDEILLHHLSISRKVWEKCRTGAMPKTRDIFGLAPNRNTHEASRQFNVDPKGPQTVICLKAVSVRKYLYIHDKPQLP